MIGIAVEIADAGYAANEGWQLRQMAIKNDPHKQPIFAISAYAYVVVRPLEHVTDLEDTNLPSMPWMENAAHFPYKPIAEGNGGTVWLELGLASEMARSMNGIEASLNSDCVIKTIALAGSEKLLRLDMYFGIDPHQNSLPPQNRNFQNSLLTPDDLDSVNLVLPIRCEIIEGGMEINIDNGQIHRAFRIPKQTTFGQSATSVATNGGFVPLDWSPATRANFEKSENIRLKKASDESAFLANGVMLETEANGDKTKDRIVSDEQKELFISLLKNYPKTPIKIFVNPENPESVTYAKKIRQLLDAANYGGSGGGIITNTGDIYTGTNFVKWQLTPHTLIFAALPHPKWGWIIPVHDTFDSFKPVISSGLTNEPNLYAVGSLDCVRWAFRGIGLNGFYIGNATNLLNPGEVGIIVPAKAK
jgi:hypothetical protein